MFLSNTKYKQLQTDISKAGRKSVGGGVATPAQRFSTPQEVYIARILTGVVGNKQPEVAEGEDAPTTFKYTGAVYYKQFTKPGNTEAPYTLDTIYKVSSAATIISAKQLAVAPPEEESTFTVVVTCVLRGTWYEVVGVLSEDLSEDFSMRWNTIDHQLEIYKDNAWGVIENGVASPLSDYIVVGPQGDDGITPHIDETTGNWFIGEDDTGVSATGEAGGVPYVGENGNWFLGDTDTGKPSRGIEGEIGPVGPGVPTGGSTNQILTKSSNTDYATSWKDAPSAIQPDSVAGGVLNGKSIGLTGGGQYELYGFKTGAADTKAFVELIAQGASNTDYKLVARKDSTSEIVYLDIGDYLNGIPDGGTTDQVLVKASDDDADAEWVDLPQPDSEEYSLINGNSIGFTNGGQYELYGFMSEVADANTLVDLLKPDAANTKYRLVVRAESTEGSLSPSISYMDIGNYLNGVPDGGTTGQMLVKKSNDDADTEWVVQTKSVPDGTATGQYLKWNNTSKVWEAVSTTTVDIVTNVSVDTSGHKILQEKRTITVLAVGSASSGTIPGGTLVPGKV